MYPERKNVEVTSMVERRERHFGLDLLRIVAMIGITIRHIDLFGGALDTASQPLHRALVWALELAAYPSVNCFLLISGYVGYRKGRVFPRLQNIIRLYMTVLFYSASLCLFFKALYPLAITKETFAAALAPITTDQYWFFTCYFGMFFLTPAIHVFVDNADERTLRIAILIVLLLFSCYCTVANLFGDSIGLNGGYHALWFASMYMAGASMKKLGTIERASSKTCVIGFLTCWLIAWMLRFIIGEMSFTFAGFSARKIGEIMQNYVSVTTVICALCIFVLFGKINVSERFTGCIQFLSGSAFSVYLIHDNNHARKYLMRDSFAFLSTLPPVIAILVEIASAAGILIACVLIDKARIWLFRAVRIDRIPDKLAKQMQRAINSLVNAMSAQD